MPPNQFFTLGPKQSVQLDTFDGIAVFLAIPYEFSTAKLPLALQSENFNVSLTLNASNSYPLMFLHDYQDDILYITNRAVRLNRNQVATVALFYPLTGTSGVYHWPVGGNETSFNGGVLLAQTGPGYYYVSLRVEKKNTLVYLWVFGDNENRALCVMCTGKPVGFESIPDSHWSIVLKDPGSIALANISPYYVDIGFKYVNVSLIEL